MPAVPTTHHVKVGTQYFILRPNSYTRRPAPQFGARFVTGDPDYNNLSIWQHWAQKCFIGGMGADEWADDAMYDEGVGLTTWSHERVVLGRDLKRGTGTGWTLDGGAVNRKFFIYNNRLYAVTLPSAGTASLLYRYDGSTQNWTAVTVGNITVHAVATFDGKIWLGGQWGGAAVLWYSSGTLTSWTAKGGLPAGASPVRAMRAFQRKLYISFGTAIWRLKENLVFDASVAFYSAAQNSESNYMVDMEVHLGFLYMLSQNGHVHRTDGNTTFDIWSWDGGTIGVALKSFDGRLFISTYEFSDGSGSLTDYGFSVIYQMSGSAMTELKRWGNETENTLISRLIVQDRKLFFGASNLLGIEAGFGIGMYDPVEDAYSIFASDRDGVTYARGAAPYNNYSVTDIIYYAGRMWALVRGHGAFQVRYTHNDYKRLVVDYDISTAGAQLGPKNGGWLTTSTYDAGTAGMNKLWRKVVVDYALPHSSTSILVEYSTDDGDSWTTAATVNPGAVHTRRKSNVWVNATSTSLKLRFTLRSTNSSYTPFLYGFVVSYLPIPEPNWMWTFTVAVPYRQELLDGTIEEPVSTENVVEALMTAYRTKALVAFTDISGYSTTSALIYDISLSPRGDQHWPYEYEVTLTLIEAAENMVAP